MINTIIICATILIIFSLILYVTKRLVEDYLSIRRDTYKDMDNKHSEKLLKLELLIASLSDSTQTLLDTPYATKEEVEDIRGRVNNNQIGKVFSPKRRG